MAEGWDDLDRRLAEVHRQLVLAGRRCDMLTRAAEARAEPAERLHARGARARARLAEIADRIAARLARLARQLGGPWRKVWKRVRRLFRRG